MGTCASLRVLPAHPTGHTHARVHTQAEVDAVLGSTKRQPTMADYGNLRYIMRCVNESMRLYPHPPVLLRRALQPDTLPGGYQVRFTRGSPAGQCAAVRVVR